MHTLDDSPNGLLHADRRRSLKVECAPHSPAATVAQEARRGSRAPAQGQQWVAVGLSQTNHRHPLGWEFAAGVDDRHLRLPSPDLAGGNQSSKEPVERSIELGGWPAERHSFHDPDNDGVTFVLKDRTSSKLQLHGRRLPYPGQLPGGLPAFRPAGKSYGFRL
jgi:hypothetical protein